MPPDGFKGPPPKICPTSGPAPSIIKLSRVAIASNEEKRVEFIFFPYRENAHKNDTQNHKCLQRHYEYLPLK